MELRLHANAATTPKTRAYIQSSTAAVAELAYELGVSETTIRRWKKRTSVRDGSHTPRKLAISLTDVEERLVVELRTNLELPLDDIVEVMRRCVNPKLSRSAIHRCLRRHGISARSKAAKDKPGIFEADEPCGFIHLDLKYLPPLNRQRAYGFVAIDRATRYVYVEIHCDRAAATARGFLQRFLAHFPHRVHTILTDNGSEWTDRFAVDKKGKPANKPSGDHPVDRLCAERGISHKLTRPFRPQTNGMVERFNRRLGEHLDRLPKNRAGHHRRFSNHAERDAYITNFVANYNRTRLKCLGHKAPLEVLSNPPGPNTSSWVGTGCMHCRFSNINEATPS
jgi:transposase InsO family protein